MRRHVSVLALLLALSPSLVMAKTLCVQLNTNGDVFVLKGIGKGSKQLSVYLADFLSGDTYTFRPMTGSSILLSDGTLVAGITRYGIDATIHSVGIDNDIVFHNLICYPGSDGKLNELDFCQDYTYTLPGNGEASLQAHVVRCESRLSVP
jgi:hypothetical protein